MNREECERTIIGLLQAVRSVYKCYAKDRGFLSMTIDDDVLFVNNRYYKEDADKQINAYMIDDRFCSREEYREVENDA